MRSASLVLLALLSLSAVAVPAQASLGCVYAGVAGFCDASYANGSCGNGFVIAWDQLWADALVAGVLVSGMQTCVGGEGYQYSGTEVFVDASTIAAGANVDWQSWGGSGGSGCSTVVDAWTLTSDDAQDLGCPAGNPPNPGWGDLLPSLP